MLFKESTVEMKKYKQFYMKTDLIFKAFLEYPRNFYCAYVYLRMGKNISAFKYQCKYLLTIVQNVYLIETVFFKLQTGILFPLLLYFVDT